MRVAAIQSNYIPWRGYFDFIASVDLFVIYDDVQYSTGSWRNRNRVKGPKGLRWLSVPVKTRLGTAIDQVKIGRSAKNWRDEHRRILEESLGDAPFFADAMDVWRDGVSADEEHLSTLNQRLIHSVCRYLDIRTPFALSRDFGLTGVKTERLLQLIQRVGADTYLSGPSAKTYIDIPLLASNGISVEYKTYDYFPYPQSWGPFDGTVSILDLIANTGPTARSHLTSATANVPAPGAASISP